MILTDYLNAIEKAQEQSIKNYKKREEIKALEAELGKMEEMMCFLNREQSRLEKAYVEEVRKNASR